MVDTAVYYLDPHPKGLSLAAGRTTSPLRDCRTCRELPHAVSHD